MRVIKTCVEVDIPPSKKSTIKHTSPITFEAIYTSSLCILYYVPLLSARSFNHESLYSILYIGVILHPSPRGFFNMSARSFFKVLFYCSFILSFSPFQPRKYRRYFYLCFEPFIYFYSLAYRLFILYSCHYPARRI